MPWSTATRVNRAVLGDLALRPLAAVFVASQATGEKYVLTDNSSTGVYRIDVEGMRQVRWPGLNDENIGIVFVDADDKVISTFNMAVSDPYFDFVLGEYVFCSVPERAKWCIFTSPNGYDGLEALAVDSDSAEAIEPDWVHTDDPGDESINSLIGVYGGSVDSLKRLRSISGVGVRNGNNTASINSEWEYDSDGELTNSSVPTSTINYTGADLINLCRMRGKGYQAADYEMSKVVANLAFAILGDRDAQAKCGYGCSSWFTTGAFNSLGNTTRIHNGGNDGNLLLGIQNFFGCHWEWMDMVGVNVSDFRSLRANGYAVVGSYPSNAVWHIYNPLTKTERTVKAVGSHGYCVGRVKFGRYADIISSKTTSDRSQWSNHYSDSYEYSGDRSRVPLRSGNNANANGGLVYSSASYAGSYSYTYYGVRLAFRGVVVFRKRQS